MMLALYTILNQLVMKLDRRLQKSAHVTNGYQAVVRVDGPPLEDFLPRKLFDGPSRKISLNH